MAAAHIDLIVKENELGQPYWIDAGVFDDDPKFTENVRLQEGVSPASHSIYLGKNVTGYLSSNIQRTLLHCHFYRGLSN